MRVRTLAVGLMVTGLALSACGKTGSPNDQGSAPTQSAAADVKVDGSPTFDKMKARGKVVIGVKDDQPNLGFKDPISGKFTGFDIEIARLVAAKLGFKEDQIQFQTVPSAGREAAISNGNVDYYVGTYTITDGRKKQVAFVGPYFTAGQGLLVRKDETSVKPVDKASLKGSLNGKVVCSVTGSTPIQRVKDNQMTESGNIRELQTYSQCVSSLENKTADVVTTDDAILKGYAAQEPDKLKVIDGTFSTEPYGIGLPHDDKAFKDKVQSIIQTALDDNTWQSIYDSTLGKSGSTATKPVLDKS